MERCLLRTSQRRKGLKWSLGDFGNFFTGGGKKTTVQNQYNDPYRALLDSVMAGGLPSVAKGYMENVAIPTTMNAATQMGLGRSGGALEAVAQTAWQPGVDIMKILMGRPLTPSRTTTTAKENKGAFDWMGDILGLGATGLDLYSKWPSSKPTTSPSPSSGYDWLSTLADPSAWKL